MKLLARITLAAVMAVMAIVAVLLVLGSASATLGQNNGAMLPWARPNFITAAGALAANGFVCTTATGTTTPLATYSEQTLTFANANPITLNAAGLPVNGANETRIYLSANSYRISVYAAGSSNTCNGSPVGTLLRQIDNVYDLALLMQEDYNPKIIDNVIHCAQYSGATAGAKIIAAFAVVPGTGGTVDCSGLEGAQTISSNIFSGVTKPINLILGAATYSVTGNMTIPSTATVTVKRGGSFSIANGITLTINGAIDAGLYPIFTYVGTGTVSFPASNSVTARANTLEVYPEWWGAVRGDNTVDSWAAISRAIAATSFGISVKLHPGWYYGLSGGAPISISREGVSIECEARMLCVVVNGGATTTGRNAYFSIDVAASSTQLKIDGLRWHGFGNGVNWTGYGLRSNTGNLIDSAIINNWIDLSSSSTQVFEGACVFTYWQNNLIELSNAGLKLSNASTACNIKDLKSFKNYNELVYLDGTASSVNAITIDGVEVNGSRFTGFRSFIDIRGAAQVSISNVNWQNTDATLIPIGINQEERGIGINVSSSTGVMISNVNLRDNRTDSQEHLRYGVKISLSDVQIVNSTIWRPGFGCVFVTGAGTSNVFISNTRCTEPTDETAAGGNAGFGDGIVIGENAVAVAGEIVITGSQILKPRLRCVYGAFAGTYNLTIIGSLLSDSAYNNGLGASCISPNTTGRVVIRDNSIIDTDGLSLMGPFITLTNAGGTNSITDNLLLGTSSFGNPKLFDPNATSWISKNQEAGFVFASLPTFSANGSDLYCSDCNGTCAAGGGTGRTCQRANGVWVN